MAQSSPAAVARTELTPLSFLERSALVFSDRVAIVHGERTLTYAEFAGQATRLARALQASGVRPGDRVAYLCPNIPELLVAHFGVPLAHAVLVAINTRLATDEVRYICDHSQATILLVDTELARVIEPVASDLATVRQIVTVDYAGAESSVPPSPTRRSSHGVRTSRCRGRSTTRTG
jgi:fatty-acyl-CoA synthase